MTAWLGPPSVLLSMPTSGPALPLRLAGSSCQGRTIDLVGEAFGAGSDNETKPVIGLIGRRMLGADIADFPQPLHELPVDFYLAGYAREVLDAGGLPVYLPTVADAVEYLPLLHGVVFSGGADLHPSLYGATPDGNGQYDQRRDHQELALLTAARSQRLPILGICRGLQLINVACGGSLHQHQPDHARYDLAPDTRVHPVTFEAESRLGALYRPWCRVQNRDALTVNSLHHQTVDRLGAGLRVSARSDDGQVEGLESTDGTILAVQWHPEMLAEPEPVFEWLIERARPHLA